MVKSICSDNCQQAKIVAFIFDVIAAGIFILFGVFSRKRYRWAFVVGMILYAIDDVLKLKYHST